MSDATIATSPAPVDLRVGVAEGADADGWVDVRERTDVAVDRGVAALVDGVPVAIFGLAAIHDADVHWYAVDHNDPITGAAVIARGLVGSTTVDGVEVPTVASPIHKERYDLGTGQRLDGPALRTWQVTEREGRILVRSSS